MHFQDANAYAPLMAGPQMDPNSPALFKHNIQVAEQHVRGIQQMAQGIISSMYAQSISEPSVFVSDTCFQRKSLPTQWSPCDASFLSDFFFF